MARILLVEDDPVFAGAVERYLCGGGHEVHVCHEPLAALKMLESARAIDLLLSDVRMPADMPHGFSLGRMAALRRPNLPMVFMTGYPEVAQRDKHPPGVVLRKPFEMPVLGAAIESALAHAAGRRP